MVEENDVLDVEWVVAVVTVLCYRDDVEDTDSGLCETLVEMVEVPEMVVDDPKEVETVELDREIVAVGLSDEPTVVVEVFVAAGLVVVTTLEEPPVAWAVELGELPVSPPELIVASGCAGSEAEAVTVVVPVIGDPWLS